MVNQDSLDGQVVFYDVFTWLFKKRLPSGFLGNNQFFKTLDLSIATLEFFASLELQDGREHVWASFH